LPLSVPRKYLACLYMSPYNIIISTAYATKVGRTSTFWEEIYSRRWNGLESTVCVCVCVCSCPKEIFSIYFHVTL